MGLSPRGRGNLEWAGWPTIRPGSIPAWAGQPVPIGRTCGILRVYPRVGGATIAPSTSEECSAGSIPAWAGQPWRSGQTVPGRGVYPRVGGATKKGISLILPPAGLSPRGRGNPQERSHRAEDGGSIPAWAGQPVRGRGKPPSLRVYPRVGGATPRPIRSHTLIPGLSPRGRGNPSPVLPSPGRRGSIPAWAGQPRRPRLECRRLWVYPRVGGATRTIS